MGLLEAVARWALFPRHHLACGDVVLPCTSFHILCWHSECTCPCIPTPSDCAHVPPLPLLACFLYIYLSQVLHAAPCGTCMAVCTAGGRNNAQKPKSFPISWISSPVSSSTHISLPLHSTQPSSSLRVQTGWVVGTEGLENQKEESGLWPRVLPSAPAPAMLAGLNSALVVSASKG